MIDSVEKAKTVIEKHDSGWPPMTDDPRVNFLIDIAKQQMYAVSESFDSTPELSDWEDVRKDYEKELEAYESEAVEIEPFDAEALSQKYLDEQ
jgi:hypothetical protein